MDFKKRIIEELEMTDIQVDTLYKGYVQVVEELAKEYHTEQLILHGIGKRFNLTYTNNGNSNMQTNQIEANSEAEALGKLMLDQPTCTWLKITDD